MTQGCRLGRQATNDGRPVQQPYVIVDFIPQVRDYEFGYRVNELLPANNLNIDTSVADPNHVNADPNLYPDPACLEPTFSFDADPYPDPNLQIKAQNLEKVLRQAFMSYICVCHLQIDADPAADPDPAYHFVADPDPLN